MWHKIKSEGRQKQISQGLVNQDKEFGHNEKPLEVFRQGSDVI